jgi:iron(III) transport system substrate-binding protein
LSRFFPFTLTQVVGVGGSKPFDFNQVRLSIQKALEASQLKREVRHLRRAQRNWYGFENVVAVSQEMKRVLIVLMVLLMGCLCFAGIAFGQAIENELYLITPVSKDVHDPALKAFAEYAKKKWNIDVKTSAIPKGTPVAYGQILEWKGRPQADIFWGGEGTLFDNLAKEGLLDQVTIPAKMWDEIPATIGKPIGLPLKDPKKFWVGTTLEPYGLIYQPKLLQRLGVTIKDWDDLLNPKLKGQIAQCTPDRSSSSHASYEVILAMYGWEKGWEWLKKLAANTGIFTARSRDVPNVVSKGEFAVGFAVPSYMAFAEVLGGYDVMFVYPTNAYVTPEPMAVLTALTITAFSNVLSFRFGLPSCRPWQQILTHFGPYFKREPRQMREYRSPKLRTVIILASCL